MAQQHLFPKDEKRIGVPVGNGYSIEWVTSKIVRAYRYGVSFKIVEINAAIDKRILAVELANESGVIKSRLSEALKISRQSLDTWLNTFRKSGFEGLVNSYKGKIQPGRADNSDKLPVGNKARQLENERKLRREQVQKQQLEINSNIAESQNELVNSEEPKSENSSVGDDNGQLDKLPEPIVPELFEETYDYRENRYAGCFLYWAMFQMFFGFMGLCSAKLHHYSVVIYLFAVMQINKIGAVEQLKTVYKREFGNLIGIKQLFSKPNLWKLIHNLCALEKSGSLIKSFFHYQAKKSLVALHWLYIDGHFVPYYGKEAIHSGFYTQRGQMMPGQTEMHVHDCHGQIVYFEVQEGKGDLKEMISRMSQEWLAYVDNVPPLVIADREAWGVENFIQMDGNRFVTWEKFSKPQELASIPDEHFGSEFIVNSKVYQAFEEKKTYRDNKGNSIELRRIVIWNKTSNRRVACVCQDGQEDTIAIATAMLGRWGCSENTFKHMGDRMNMHYNPVVDASNESERQEIANPVLAELKKDISRLRKRLAKIERDLGRMTLTQNKDGSLRKSKKREGLQNKVEDLKKKIVAKEQTLANCPERVNINEVKAGTKYKVLSTEGKNLWNLAETLFWNSRKKLVQIFKEFLPNERDLRPVLEAITESRGWIKSTSEAIEIRLEPLETPMYKAAQIQLCRYLNEKEIRLQNGKRLLYDVGPDPTKTVQ
ncbi:MAG: hypothetical protein GY861_15095 [bacterium]|nr:hypothetical protein [bacterium]